LKVFERKMTEGIIENVVRKEIDRHYSNVFTEFKTDILISQDKIASIYLGNLKRFEQERYTKPEDVHLSEGKRDIKIKVESMHEPITKLWLENGFDFFKKLGEKNINLRWEHCLDRIKTSPKEKDVIELINDFKKDSGKSLYYEYFDAMPSFGISDDMLLVKKFVDDYKKAINFDELILKNYHHRLEYSLDISRHLLDLEISGTNLDAKNYAKMVDEFLGD